MPDVTVSYVFLDFFLHYCNVISSSNFDKLCAKLAFKNLNLFNAFEDPGGVFSLVLRPFSDSRNFMCYFKWHKQYIAILFEKPLIDTHELLSVSYTQLHQLPTAKYGYTTFIYRIGNKFVIDFAIVSVLFTVYIQK